jgi:DNA-binding CsgD family transcriptional regulator
VARGDTTAADRARALLEGPFDWMATLVAGIVLTDAAALRGDVDAAVGHARTTVDALTGESGPRPDATVRFAALVLSAVADAEDADRRADTVTEWTQWARASAAVGEDGRPQGPEGMAWLARVEAEAVRARTGPDVEAWQRAVDAFAWGGGDLYEEARCRYRLAEALLRAGRREEAAAQARTARATAARLGAGPLVEALDALRTTTLPALTARERDVLRLLALGRTNRQIGEELYITTKTASVHVSNILAKLGATTRTEAAALARREGLLR